MTQTEERNNAMKAQIEHLKEGVCFTDTRDAIKKVFVVTHLSCFLLIILLILIHSWDLYCSWSNGILRVGATMSTEFLWYSLE
jgi:hypothetical protein